LGFPILNSTAWSFMIDLRSIKTITSQFVMVLKYLAAVMYALLIFMCILYIVHSFSSKTTTAPIDSNEDISYLEDVHGLTSENLEDVIYVSNYDADTVTVNIANVPYIFGHHIAVRVAHIDSPEIKSPNKCDQEAAKRGKVEVENLLKGANKIDLINVHRDKYFRILAEVRIDDSIWLHEYVLSKKLAVPYEGDKKPVIDWCSYTTH